VAFVIAVLAGALSSAPAQSEVVLHAPPQHTTLAARLQWARSAAGQHADGVWVGYSIQRFMHENSHIGNYGSRTRDLPTLDQVLRGETVPAPSAGVTREQRMLNAARRALRSGSDDKEPREKVLKDVAIVFRLPPRAKDLTQLEKVRISNLDLHVDLDGLALLWLGAVKDAESIPLLDGLYGKVQERKPRKDLMVAVSLHDTKDLVVPVLQRYVTKEKDENLRSEAAFWLGQQDHPEALKTLRKVVKDDASLKVRKKAVFALSQMSLEGATDGLIDVARSDASRDVQKEAIFWLGQKASAKARQSLKDVVFDNEETEIQEQAVFAISQWPKDQRIPALGDIAKNHPHPKIREKAIFWLGETRDPRAVETLVEILKGST
jgi:HEAT repeat protein